MFNISFGKENTALSLLDIHKLRASKLNKSQLFHGKKILMKRMGKKALFLVNAATIMANRLGCDSSMQASARSVLGKRSRKNNRVIVSACEVKNREK
jgi:hypothetical protein